MKRGQRERAIINRRKNLWSRMGWYWPFKRNDGGRTKTKWTSDKHEEGGNGYFRKNHSLSCKNCACCRSMLQEKIDFRRKRRRQRKLEGKELLKRVMNNIEL